MPASGVLLKVGIAALALPLLNTLFLFWAHFNAYRRGHLAAGTILGVTLGPLGVLIAEFLPKLGRSSAAIVAQLDAREDAPHGTWASGLVLLYLGTALGGGVAGWLLLEQPQSNWLGIAAIGALILIVGGSSLVTRGLPPERFAPPLEDASEYLDDAPDFAADLDRAHSQHLLQHRAAVLRQAAVVCAVFAVLGGLAALVMLTADGTLQEVPHIRSYGWLAASGALLFGLAAFAFSQRSREALAELQQRAADYAIDFIDWHPAIPRDLAREYVRCGQTAQEAYQRHIQLRIWAITLSAACIVGTAKALLGVLFNIGPVVGNWALLFLAPLAFSWLILRWRSEADARWFEFETNAWDAVRASEKINIHLPPESREETGPPPPKIDSSFEFAETVNCCANYCFRLAMLSFFAKFYSALPIWLGAWVVLHLLAQALSKRVAEDLVALGALDPEALQPEAYRRQPASPAPIPQADASDQPEYVHGVSREWLEQMEQDERLEEMGKQHQTLLGQLRAVGFFAATLAYIGIVTLALTLEGLRVPPESWEDPERLSLWPAFWLAGGGLLLLLRGRIEDQISALPQTFIRDSGHRNYAAAQALCERLQRGLQVLRRLLGTAAVVLATTALGDMVLTADGMTDALQRSRGALILLELGAVAVLAVGTVSLVNLRRKLAQTKRYSAGLAAQHFREQVAAAVARQQQKQEMTVEDHGHFMVEHQAGPPAEYIEQRVKRITADILDRDPLRVGLDVARSLCYTSAALLGIWYFVARPPGGGPNQPSPLLVPVLGLLVLGLILGLFVRLRTPSPA